MNVNPMGDDPVSYLPSNRPCREQHRGPAPAANAPPTPCPHGRPIQTRRCRGNEPFFDRSPNHVEGPICHKCTLATIQWIENRPLPAGATNPLNAINTPFRNFYYDMWLPTCGECRRRELHWFYRGKNTCICSSRIRGWKCHACLHHAHQRTIESSQHYRGVLLLGRREDRQRHGRFITRRSRRNAPVDDANVYCRCGNIRSVDDRRDFTVLFCLGCRGTIVNTFLNYQPPLRARDKASCPPDYWPVYDENTQETI